jgi:hypothetical protein
VGCHLAMMVSGTTLHYDVLAPSVYLINNYDRYGMGRSNQTNATVSRKNTETGWEDYGV